MNTFSRTLLTGAVAGLLSFTAWGQAATDAGATTTTTTTTNTTPAATAKDSVVGLSARDGITMSDAGAMVTRNGVTQKMADEVKLEGGVRVLPDGTMIGTDGTRAMLRPQQILTFDGKLMSLPSRQGSPVQGSVPVAQ